MVYAVTGHTAAEIIVARAKADKPNMGLTSWKGGRVRKGDVTTAKSYLNQEEISELNRIVTMFLDSAEGSGAPPQAHAHGRLGGADRPVSGFQ